VRKEQWSGSSWLHGQLLRGWPNSSMACVWSDGAVPLLHGNLCLLQALLADCMIAAIVLCRLLGACMCHAAAAHASTML
jgi:hypothetical protein